MRRTLMPASIQASAISHIALCVRDLERSLQFYRDAQSVPFLVLTEHPGDTVSGTPIMLDQVGISHMSFTVPSVEEVTQRLLAHGAQTCGPADAFRDASGRIRTVFFRDPDGILVQFDEGGEG